MVKCQVSESAGFWYREYFYVYVFPIVRRSVCLYLVLTNPSSYSSDMIMIFNSIPTGDSNNCITISKERPAEQYFNKQTRY